MLTSSTPEVTARLQRVLPLFIFVIGEEQHGAGAIGAVRQRVERFQGLRALQDVDAQGLLVLGRGGQHGGGEYLVELFPLQGAGGVFAHGVALARHFFEDHKLCLPLSLDISYHRRTRQASAAWGAKYCDKFTVL